MFMNFFDMNPAGLQVCDSGPWPYTPPTPDADASHLTHMGSVLLKFTGFNIGVFVARCFILSKHVWCISFHKNIDFSPVSVANGPVQAITSGIKCDKYCTNPRNC